MKFTAILLLSIIFSPVALPSWQDDLEQTYSAFVACSNSDSGNCEAFTVKAIEDVYHVKDLTGIRSNESLYIHIKSKSAWDDLGQAYNQQVLNKAQELANSGSAVVAVYTNGADQPLHIVAILPGELNPSGSWGMNVPNAASFPDFNPENAFINKPMSYAFEKKALLKIRLYARNG